MIVPEELADAGLQPHDRVVGWGAQVEPAVVESEVLPQSRERSVRVLCSITHHASHTTQRGMAAACIIPRYGMRGVATATVKGIVYDLIFSDAGFVRVLAHGVVKEQGQSARRG